MENLSSIKEIRDFIMKNQLALLYFSSPDCKVCDVLIPKVEEMIKNYSSIQIATVNIKMVPEVAGEYSIFTIPTILLFINNEEFIREARHISVIQLEEKIKRYYYLLS